MKIKILFPCDPFDHKIVDSNFKNEYEVSKALGIESFFYDHDLFVDEEKLKLYGIKDDICGIIMRTWMLTPSQYEKLFDCLMLRNNVPYVSPYGYEQCHYLSESYKYIEQYTAKTLFSEDLSEETLGKMFDQFPDGIVLKDYVKSEKHVPGLFRIPKETTHQQLKSVVDRFVEARGKLFNKGIAFREFVPLKKYEGEVNEWRAFIFNGKVAALEQNSNINRLTNFIDKPSERIINSIIGKLYNKSVFYTIDFAEKENGDWMVVETGDGQVSGVAPNQNPIGLYNAFIPKVGDDCNFMLDCDTHIGKITKIEDDKASVMVYFGEVTDIPLSEIEFVRV